MQPETRLQEINGDRVLEILSSEVNTIRLSENALIRQRDYLEAAIATFQTELDEVRANLLLISEKHAEATQAKAI